MAADGRLGHVQGLGGGDVAAELGGGLEGAHGIEGRQTADGHGRGGTFWLLVFLISHVRKLSFIGRFPCQMIGPEHEEQQPPYQLPVYARPIAGTA
ncbi:hypothetical protein D3C76_1449730 [compost metagenome]